MFPATPCQQEEDTKRHARKARGARAVDVIRSHGNRRAAHRRERLPTILRHIVFQRLAVRVPAEGIDREIIHKDRGGWENGGRPWRRRKLPLLPEVDERGHLATPRAPSGNIVGGGSSASPRPPCPQNSRPASPSPSADATASAGPRDARHLPHSACPQTSRTVSRWRVVAEAA